MAQKRMARTQVTQTRRRAGLRELIGRPEVTTDLTQILKCTIAATVAWWLSADVLESPLPFLAPWTALLTVHATVHRSLSRGLQTTVASAIGVGLSFLIGVYLGVNVWTFALAMFVGLAGARISWIRDEGVAIATTAVFVLGSGFSQQQPLLVDRIVEVAIGVGIGVLVNLLIIPPLRDQQARSHVESINRRVGEMLVRVADEFSESWETDAADAWRDEIESMGEEVDTAWRTVRFARESRRSNPRRLTRAHRAPGRTPRAGAEIGYEAILPRVDEGVSHLRHLVRTLNEATYAEGPWDERFRTRWSGVVRDAGNAIADPAAEVEPIRDRLVRLARDMSDDVDLPRDSWPLYGALLTSMNRIAMLIDDAATASDAQSSGEPQTGT
ncbi:FUSC family protein [Rhodococcus sp. IEGM 1408]|uniref:FUSC family protein n=1 Tax=Rhodococcus sp. IEGM 1408 TaxID=3082220 RepID=UPI002955CC3D|nr:aromatic acid exporter family protein [Rhodococcus sp. IEGM 1408]MDV7999757.1 aromatic acid exporter family protein [Rhodococcus sp. IEGM 1408]